MEQVSFHAMGSTILAVLDADGARARAALARLPGWFAAWERALSRFRPDSELSALNRRGRGRPGAALWSALGAALEAARLSGGLVSPALLDAVEAAGYDRDFAALAGGAGPARAAPPPAPEAWRAIRLDRRARAVSLTPGLRLDLGGVAKGWAAARAVARLRAHGPALVDAGGDIALSGPRAGGEPWPIGVADPRRPGQQIALLRLAGGGVATSGRDYRRWRAGGEERHHIIDPRTGAPARSDILAATVVAPAAPLAEMAAKVALILGGEAGLAWVDARPRLAALLVREDGAILSSRHMADYLW